MAVSLILLEIEGAPGDATMVGYEQHIVVESFTWDVKAKTIEKVIDDSMTTIDAGAVSIKKQFDKSSTVLRDRMKKGAKPFTAFLRFVDLSSRSGAASKGMGKVDTVLEVKLTGCHVDKISLEASDAGKSVKLSESLTLSYETSAKFSYSSFDAVKKARGQTKSVEMPPTGKKADAT